MENKNIFIEEKENKDGDELFDIDERIKQVTEIADAIKEIQSDENLSPEQKDEAIKDLVLFEEAGIVNYEKEKERLFNLKRESEAASFDNVENQFTHTESGERFERMLQHKKQIKAFKEFKAFSVLLWDKLNRVNNDLKKTGVKFDSFNNLISDLEVFGKFNENKVISYINEGNFGRLVAFIEKSADKLKSDYILVMKDLSGISNDKIEMQATFIEDEMKNYFNYLYENKLIRELINIDFVNFNSDVDFKN